MPFEFGDCVFDPETRELTRGGRAVALSPKAFALLSTLLAQRPRALSKEDLHEAIWPGTFVSDSSLARLVSELRSLVGEDASEPHLVRTVHGFGYAFSGQVRETRGQVRETRGQVRETRGQVRETRGQARETCGQARETRDKNLATPVCWLVRGRRVAPLEAGDNLIGRSPDSVVAIDSAKVSRRHTRIRVAGDEATLEDLGSKNGTYVEGRRVKGPVVLRDGDQISIGPTVLTFRRGEGGVSTETELSAILR